MISIAVILLFFSSSGCGVASAAGDALYDVVVIGAGSGGCAAAIQAARMGMTVALVEQSDWVGGQMTGAAVSTMDDKGMTRTGIYLEFISRVKDLYSAWGKNVNVCYWGSDTIAFEPWAGQKILLEMLAETGHVTLILRAKPVSARTSGHRVTSAVFDADGKKVVLNAKVFIDATECGDFIPLTGARYRAGKSISPKIDKDGVIQDITYAAVIKKYPGGLPAELKVSTPPPGYTGYLFKFRAMFRKDGNSWPGEYPFDVPTHNAYRAMPDPSSGAVIDGGDPSTWPHITKTAINWANDYPGRDSGVPGLSVEFLEDKEYRLRSERMAMAKTLAFIYYMQNELGMSDWSVDDRQGYGGWFSNDWRNWKEMPESYAPILRHFPPYPYVRESRRIVGITTMTVKDIKRDPVLKRTLSSRADSVALGEYPIDIHGIRDTKYLDRDLGETTDMIPDDQNSEGGLFQIPFGALIPEKVDGLIAAEKNISVSRTVNGSTRLQPVTMLTGQAAGAIAALAVDRKVQPRDLRPLDVQSALLVSKARLSLHRFNDVPEYAASWPGAEIATVYGYMDPRAENNFGAYEEMHWVEIRDAFRRAFGIKDFPKRADTDRPVGTDEFAGWLKELYSKDIKRYEDAIDGLVGSGALTKGKLASTIFAIMKASPAKEKK